MTGQQRLLSLWLWLLLMAALCPGAHYAYGKRGGFFKAKGKDSKGDDSKGDASKAPPSKGRGLPKQGLKWAGAAAAGILVPGTGYGLGLLGKAKHGSGNHHSHKTEQDQRQYYDQRQGSHSNQSLWRTFVRAAAPAPTINIFLTLGHVVSFLLAAWI